jgi:hypothetical protein
MQLDKSGHSYTHTHEGKQAVIKEKLYSIYSKYEMKSPFSKQSSASNAIRGTRNTRKANSFTRTLDSGSYWIYQ